MSQKEAITAKAQARIEEAREELQRLQRKRAGIGAAENAPALDAELEKLRERTAAFSARLAEVRGTQPEAMVDAVEELERAWSGVSEVMAHTKSQF